MVFPYVSRTLQNNTPVLQGSDSRKRAERAWFPAAPQLCDGQGRFVSFSSFALLDQGTDGLEQLSTARHRSKLEQVFSASRTNGWISGFPSNDQARRLGQPNFHTRISGLPKNISADNRRRVGHKKCSLPLYLIPRPVSDYCRGGGGSTYHAVIPRCSTKSFLLGAESRIAPPGQHRQHHLHHPHQRLPRMRMMQVMLGILPMLVKEHLGMKENAWK